MKFAIRLASVSLAVFSVSPLFGQFTNAQSIWNRPINSLQPANGQALCWDASSTPPRWTPAACLNAGPTGPAGANGQGVPTGGTTSQMLVKTSNANFATAWVASPITQAAVSHQVLLSYTSTTGAFTSGQLAFGDISGLAPIAASGSASDLSTGTLPDARLSSNVVKYDTAGAYTAGRKQTFGSSSTTAMWNLGTLTADPSSLSTSDFWYRSDLFLIRYIWSGIKGSLPYVVDPLPTTGLCAQWLANGQLGAASAACGSGGGSSFYQTVISDSSTMTQRAKLNLKAGTGITLTPVDNPGANSSEITIDGIIGANTGLSNLSSVSINTSLIPQTGVSLGGPSTPFKDFYMYGSGSFGAANYHFTGTPTAARLFNLPDADSNSVVGLANPSDTQVVNYIDVLGVQHRIPQSGGSTNAPYYSSLFTGPDTSRTITGATHGFTNPGLIVTIFDNNSPRGTIESPCTVNSSTYDVVCTFNVAQSNYYVSINGGVGPKGDTGATGPAGGVTSVSGTSPISSTGGSTPAISLNDTAVVPGTYTSPSLTIDQKGRITAASNGSTGTGNAAFLVSSTSLAATTTFTCPTSSSGTVGVFQPSLPLSTNVTSSSVTGCTIGSVVAFKITQATSGGPYTFAWPTNFLQTCPVSTIASVESTGTWYYDGTNWTNLTCGSNETASIVRMSSARTDPGTGGCATPGTGGGCLFPLTGASTLLRYRSPTDVLSAPFKIGQDCNPDTGICTTSNGNAILSVIASGATAMATSAISANTCASVITVSATGTTTSGTGSRITWTPSTDPSGVTGYGILSTDGLKVYVYPTANNVNFKVCNGSGSSITPGALTFNWSVM